MEGRANSMEELMDEEVGPATIYRELECPSTDMTCTGRDLAFTVRAPHRERRREARKSSASHRSQASAVAT
jgi:hypothetical protein